MKHILNSLSKGSQAAFYTITIIAVALMVIGFFCPPLAVIDNSVLAAAGELFAFASLTIVLIAIDKGTTAKLSHNNTSISIQKQEKEENN